MLVKRIFRKFSDLKKTALWDYHQTKLGCNKMIEFAGYSMPAFYKSWGVVKEHQACRNYAAVFDVSHMGQLK